MERAPWYKIRNPQGMNRSRLARLRSSPCGVGLCEAPAALSNLITEAAIRSAVENQPLLTAPDGEKALVILSTAPRLIPVPRCCCICWYCSAGPLAIFWNDLAVAAALDLPDPVTRNSAAAFLANFGSEVCTFWTPDQPFRWEQGP
jgi:hypothetical protein